MIYLALSILLTTSLVLFFKVFEKYNINTFQALVFNYLTASLIGLVSSGVTRSDLHYQQWFPLSLLLGGLFISIFYAVSLTTVRISVSAATVANKMSVVIPVIAAFYLYNDTMSVQKIAGILLALPAVYMTARKKSMAKVSEGGKLLFLLPVIVFFGSGVIDMIVNFVQVNYLHGQNNALFLAASFGVAFLIGLIILCIQLATGRSKLELKNIVGGICLGIPNFFSIYTLIKALDSNLFESTILYPVNNVGIVVISAIAAYFLFKEKLSKLNIAGIVCALVSIVLISIKLF